MIVPGENIFNMWRALYIDRFGSVPDGIGYAEALSRLTSLCELLVESLHDGRLEKNALPSLLGS